MVSFSLLELLLMNISPTVLPQCYPFVSTPSFSWFSNLHACLLRGEGKNSSLTSSRQDAFQIRRRPVPLCLLEQGQSSTIQILSSVLPHISHLKNSAKLWDSCINDKKKKKKILPICWSQCLTLVGDNRSQLTFSTLWWVKCCESVASHWKEELGVKTMKHNLPTSNTYSRWLLHRAALVQPNCIKK